MVATAVADRLVLPRRTQADVLLAQVRGIEAWTRAHRALVHDGLDGAPSRESRLDLARRRDVVLRQRQALEDWTARQLRESDLLVRSLARRRVVLAQRDAWFRGAVATGLQAGGTSVVADVDNGADALGVLVAEQPDLLLVEDKLPLVTGLDLVRAAARYAPGTVVVVRVTGGGDVGVFLDAGAAVVHTRRTPPQDLVTALLAASSV